MCSTASSGSTGELPRLREGDAECRSVEGRLASSPNAMPTTAPRALRGGRSHRTRLPARRSTVAGRFKLGHVPSPGGLRGGYPGRISRFVLGPAQSSRSAPSGWCATPAGVGPTSRRIGSCGLAPRSRRRRGSPGSSRARAFMSASAWTTVHSACAEIMPCAWAMRAVISSTAFWFNTPSPYAFPARPTRCHAALTAQIGKSRRAMREPDLSRPDEAGLSRDPGRGR
jgi:hypothetical protein